MPASIPGAAAAVVTAFTLAACVPHHYNDLVSAYTADPKGFECGRFGALDDTLGEYRNSAPVNGLGSRSTENLVYRALRRLTVSIPSMLDTLEVQCTFAHESMG